MINAECEKVIQDAFRGMCDIYLNIFRVYYPAHNSTGFPERNITCNFVASLRQLCPNAVAWFEAPITKGNVQHMDAVAFLPDLKTMLMIESKRLSDVYKKERELVDDLKRTRMPSTQQMLKNGLFNLEINHSISVLLADIWLETELKKKFFKEWPPKWISDLGGVTTDKISFSENGICNKCLEKYMMLLAAVEV